MAEGSTAKKGIFKTILGGLAGLAAGGLGVYATAVVNQVAKPARPVANFAVSAEGLQVTCQNHATGQSGWWDFGDGTPLEQFNSELPTVTHTYAKPGNYAVKLTVRNFLMEENERTVPVDLNAASATTGPIIPSFSVEAIGGAATAPATFRVRGEVKNADRVIWDLGSEQLEVAESPGSFEKLVVFEKPGPYQLQLIGYSGKQAVKKAVQVNVSEARQGTLSAVVRVTDSGTRVEKKEVLETVALPVPTKGTTSIERTLAARPGFTIQEAKLGKVSTGPVKNVRLQVAPDKKSVKVQADWTGATDASAKAAGGSDILVSVLLQEERAFPMNVATETIATQFALEGSFILSDPNRAAQVAVLPLPPVPANVVNHQRKIQFEVREMSANRESRVIGALPDLKPPFRGTVQTSLGQQIVDVQVLPSGQLRVSLLSSLGGRS